MRLKRTLSVSYAHACLHGFLVSVSPRVTAADNRSHMRAWPAPYAYYTLNKPTPAAQDETFMV